MDEVTLYRVEPEGTDKEFFIVSDEEGRMLYRKEKYFPLDYKNPNEKITVLPAGEDGIQQAVLRVYWCMWPHDCQGDMVSDDPVELEVYATIKESKSIPYSRFEEVVEKRKEMMALKKEKRRKAEDIVQEKYEEMEEEYDRALAKTSDPDYLDKVEEDHEGRKKKLAKELVNTMLGIHIPTLEEMLWAD